MYKTLITKDRLDELVRLCGISPYGLSVELGVYKGGSLKYLLENYPERNWFGFDTFSGLPLEHWNKNEIHQPGDFSDNSFESVMQYLNNTKAILIKGLFPDTARGLFGTEEDKSFSFVHVDFDFYEGAKSAIDFFYPRLMEGGIMVFDDFQWPNCPGVKKALDESGLEYQPTNAKFQAYIIKDGNINK
jgi:O-methyltransferase